MEQNYEISSSQSSPGTHAHVRLKNGSFLPIQLHEAVVSSSVLSNLKVLNNCWVFLNVHEDNHKRKNTTLSEKSQWLHDGSGILLRLVSFEDLLLRGNETNFLNDLDLGAIYLHAETAFSVFNCRNDCFQSFYEGNLLHINVKPVQNLTFAPPIASTVTVSIVRTPEVTTDIEYDQHLCTYFETTRHLNVNQLFRIDTGLSQGSYLNGFSHSFWFKVINIEHEARPVVSAWIKNGATTLFAKDSINSFVPNLNWIGNKTDLDSFGMIGGLSKYFSRIAELFKPVIQRHVASCETALLLHGPAAVGKRSLIQELSCYYCLHFYEVNCFTIIGDSIAAMEQRIEGIFKKAMYCSPCVLFLRNIHALCKDKDGDDEEPRLVHCVAKCISNLARSSSIVLIIGSTNCYNEMTTDLCRCFTYDIEVEVPDEEGRYQALTGICHGLSVSRNCLESVAKKTAGMVLGDLCALTSEAINASKSRLNASSSELNQVMEVSMADFDAALEKIHTEYKDNLGMPKIPKVSWSDVGGLVDVKAEIIDTINIPLQYPELTKKGLKRSGILLYGPPGCGKTLLAKAVASEFSLNFFSIKGPELINMYVGQSEQNVRDMFKKARECAPCVVFFDELDSIAPNRGKSGDSGGVMDRVVSQLLAELDGIHSSNELFVIGATNRPDLLDNALLRPGRFDKLVYVGFPETKDDRLNILRSYTSKMNLGQDFDLDRIEESLPLYLTGADFYALCSDAVLNAIRSRIEVLDKGIENDCEDLVIDMNNFLAAVKELVPSISTEDVIKYKEMKRRIANEKQNT